MYTIKVDKRESSEGWQQGGVNMEFNGQEEGVGGFLGEAEIGSWEQKISTE